MELIKSEITILEHKAPFRAYIPEVAPDAAYKVGRPAVIIFPGGGYGFTFPGEAEPIALKFVSEGICAFILDYACVGSGKTFPTALLEALSAVKYVREKADDFGIDKHNIATLGFSAGGHLCSCTGTLWNKPILDEYFENGILTGERYDYRPDKMVLCYPVISTDPSIANKGSFVNLMNKPFDEISKSVLDVISTEKQIDSKTPPAFIWSTAEDSGVDCRNSLNFAAGLVQNKVPYQIYIYPHGNHGLCTGDCVTRPMTYEGANDCSEWTRKAVKFLYEGINNEAAF